MRLSGKTVKGLEFRHPLFQAGLRVMTPERVSVILPSIRLADREACHEAILGYTLLALQITGRYLRKLGSDQLSDDLSGAALEGVTHAVNKVARGEAVVDHDNLTGYVTETVHRHISDFLNHRSLIYVPRQTIQDRRYKGKEQIKRPSRVDLKAANEPTQPEGLLEFEFEEILARVIHSDIEGKIIQCRREGMTDAEIASYLNLAKTTVFLIRKEVESRFLELIR